MRSRKYDFSTDLNAIAIENSPCNIFFINEFGKIFHANHTGCDRFGYAYEKITEMYIWDIDTVSLNSYEKYLSIFESIQNNQNISKFNSFCTTLQGIQFPVEIHVKSYQHIDIKYCIVYIFDKTKEFELENEQEIYTNMLAFVNEYIFILNVVTNKIVFANETVCKTSGYSLEELKEMYIADIIRPFNKNDTFYETIANMDKQDNIDSYEVLLTRSGRTIPVETSSRIKKTNQNTYRISILKAIPERLQYIQKRRTLNKKLKDYNINLENEVQKQTKELNETNERLSLAIESSSDGFWDWDIKTNKIFFSPVWKNILGYKQNELDNNFSTWKKLVRTNHKRTSWQLFNEFIKNLDTSIKLNFDMRHKDGYLIPIECKIKKILDQNGQALRLIGTYTDMTKTLEVKKQKETIRNNLIESEKTLDAIFNFAKVGLLLLNEQRIILKVNDYFLKESGYNSKYELIGQTTRVFFENDAAYTNFEKESYNKLTDGNIPKIVLHALKKDKSKIMCELIGNKLPNNTYLWTIHILKDYKEETFLEKTNN